ncbi:MAG: hypothetical protein WKF73_14075 [Nocardioidaceae bacterium]
MAVIIKPAYKTPLNGLRLRLHGMNRMGHDSIFDRFDHLLIDDRSWAIGSHAACIRPSITIEGWFMILSRRQCEKRFAIGDR